MPVPQVTIVMRSYNEGRYIEDTIKAVLAQRYRDFTLLHVDSGSTDNCVEVIRRYGHELIEIAKEQYNPGRVVNMVAQRAESPWLVFCNADAIPQNDRWLETLIQPLEREKVAAAFSRQLPRPDAWGFVKKDMAMGYGETEAGIGMSFFFSIVSAALKRDLVLANKFWEGLLVAEDIDWSYRMKNAGYELAYVPESVVVHSHNYTPASLWRRCKREGEGAVHIFGEKPSLAGQCMRALKLTAGDCVYCIKRGHIGSSIISPFYRTWQCMAHYFGTRAVARGRDQKNA